MQRFDDGRTLPPRLDQPVGSQTHQLLRHRHLLDVEFLTQFGNRFLIPAESAKHQQPLRMREAAQQVGRLAGCRDHFSYIHVLEFIIFEC